MATQQQLPTIHEQNETKVTTIPYVTLDGNEESHVSNYDYSSGLMIENNTVTHAADDSWLVACGRDAFLFAKSVGVQYVEYTFEIGQTAQGRIQIGIMNCSIDYDFISNPNASNMIDGRSMINLENHNIKAGDTIKLRIDVTEKALVLFYHKYSNFKVIKILDIPQIIDQESYKLAIKLYHKYDCIKIIDCDRYDKRRKHEILSDDEIGQEIRNHCQVHIYI